VKNKIVVLSQCKNGTTTICSSIQMVSKMKLHGWLGNKFYRKKHKEVWLPELFKEIDKYDILHDDPMPFIYQELHEHYQAMGIRPKYILSYRNPEDWYNSFHYGFSRDWSGKYRGKRKLYPYDLRDITKKELFINAYIRLNEKIIKYFNDTCPEDFLHFDIGDWSGRSDYENWKFLLDFCQVEYDDAYIREKPFPKLRARKK
jgi:hypothetical protein